VFAIFLVVSCGRRRQRLDLAEELRILQIALASVQNRLAQPVVDFKIGAIFTLLDATSILPYRAVHRC
jgi:hypothetical protein